MPMLVHAVASSKECNKEVIIILPLKYVENPNKAKHLMKYKNIRLKMPIETCLVDPSMTRHQIF